MKNPKHDSAILLMVLGGMFLIANLSNVTDLKRWGIGRFIVINVVCAAAIYAGVRLYRSWKEDREIERRYREKEAARTIKDLYKPDAVHAVPGETAEKSAQAAYPSEEIDDITYIREIRHSRENIWHIYDVMLNSRGYGWEMMLNWADYMVSADLQDISTVTSGNMGEQKKDHTEQFQNADGKVSAIPALAEEQGSLSVGGLSRTLNRPVKITWFNQTRVLQITTLCGSDDSLNRYCETMIRRTFGTPDAMKHAKPIPEAESAG